MSWETIVKGNKLAVTQIPFDEVLKINRLDAEYFDPLYLEQDSVLSAKTSSSISKYVAISDGNHLSITEHFIEEGGVPYFRGQDVNNIFLNSANPMRIPKEIYQKGWMKRSHFKANDILLSIVGTIGSLSFVPDDLGEASGSCKIAILRSKETSRAKTLMVFLLGKYGQYQLKRMTRGAVQMGIILEDIPKIIVPDFTEKIISAVNGLIERVFETEAKSRKRYAEAEQLLLKEINLEDYKGTEEAISVRNFTDCLADNRFDAEYWQPKYDEIEERVSKVPQEKLGNIVSAKKGVEVGSEAYGEEGKDFIRVSDFTIYGIEDVEKKISEELYEGLQENYKPKKGEVLFTKDGTIGISFAINEDVDAIVSGAFLRLKPKVKINNNYLALVLNSFYCKAQIERMSGGAVIAHLKPESAMQVKIPMLSEKKQEELTNKVLEALRLRKEAKELLERAKRALEIFVEEDEKSALEYLSK